MRMTAYDAQWMQAFLAGLATILAVWPITALMRDDSWFTDAIGIVVVVALSGAVLRAVGLGQSGVILLQLAVTWAVVARLTLAPTLMWWVVPTGATAETAADLLAEAGSVLSTFAAPAPVTAGVAFLLLASVALAGIAVDALAVTGRSPALAGIPLAAIFLASVSNTGAPLPVHYFLALSIAWLALLIREGDQYLHWWPSEARQPSGVSFPPPSRLQRPHAPARALGLAVVLIALVGASLLPHLPPTFLADGLGRSSDSGGDGDGTAEVGFTETMDPSQDLRNTSTTPVLTYDTNARIPGPLRVTASEEFDGQRWLPPEDADQGSPDLTVAGNQDELSDDAARTRSLDVVDNSLAPPHLAMPSRPTSTTLPESAFRIASSGAIRNPGAVDSYEVDYRDLGAYDDLPADILSAPPVALNNGGSDSPYLDVPQEARPAIREALAEAVPQGTTSAMGLATAIQDHLRGGSFAYSLDLAPGVEDASDPISHFLATEQGYCVQFASAMVMMARAEGIPARMAIGFLPGALQPDGTREVVASDAHTWPELLITGLGWTRFEPTPGTRSGPVPDHTNTIISDAGEAEQVPDAADPSEASPSASATGDEATLTSGEGMAGWSPAGFAAAAALLAALLMLALSRAGRRYRQAGLKVGQGVPDRAEGVWLWMARSLDDLGVPMAPQASPRAMAEHYRRLTQLQSPAEKDLQDVAATLEDLRYAGHNTSQEALAERVHEMHSQAQSVVTAVRQQTPANVRVTALLAPRSGRKYLGERLGRAQSR